VTALFTPSDETLDTAPAVFSPVDGLLPIGPLSLFNCCLFASSDFTEGICINFSLASKPLLRDQLVDLVGPPAASSRAVLAKGKGRDCGFDQLAYKYLEVRHCLINAVDRGEAKGELEKPAACSYSVFVYKLPIPPALIAVRTGHS
jgi:hypothetical protein